MFSFGRGKKKDESDKKSTAGSVAPSTGASAAPAADLFGGMQQRTRRRKKGADDDDSKSVAASERPDDKSTASAETKPAEAEAPAAKPFFSSFNFSATGNVDMTGIEDDAETAAVKKRLERFYSHYNPSKLASIDDTVKRFKGRESALFEALVSKYGPEPSEQGEPMPAKSAGGRSKGSVAGSDHVSASPPTRRKDADDFGDGSAEEPKPADGFGGDNFGGAGFGDASAESPGFGDTDGFGAEGGFGDTGAAGGFGDAGGFGAGEADADAGFGGGFGDATDAPTGENDGFGGGAFGNVEVPEDGGFGAAPNFDNADGANPEPETEGTFGFGGEEADTGFGGGFGDAGASAPEEVTRPTVDAGAKQPPTPSSSSSSSGDDLTDLERQDIVIAGSRDIVGAARTTLASALNSEAERSATRRRLIAEYASLEAQLDKLTAEEDWEGADATNEKLAEVADAIEQASDRNGEHAAVLSAAAVDQALAQLAKTYAEQRAVLQDTRAEVERKTTNYINESKSRLESVGETVRADLDKARRNLEYTQQEVTRVEQRREKIEEKIREQTKEIREERDKVSGQATTLEKEVAELERTLAAKRKALAERKGQLSDMDHQLSLIEDNHRESMQRVTAEEATERAKLNEAESQAERLAQAQESNARAEAELAEETEAMYKELEEHSVRIRRFERNSKALAETVSGEFSQFFTKAVADVVAMRSAEGSECLSSGPHQSSSQGGPLAAVQTKLVAARSAVESNLEQESALRRRMEEISQSIPTLEAAKKAAATAKQFKEASAKTAEIKRLNDEKAMCTTQREELLTAAPVLAADVEQLEVEKTKEVASHRARIRVFTDGYAATLRKAWFTLQESARRDTGQTANLYYVDTLPLEPKSDQAVWVNAHPDDEDVIREAARAFIKSCFGELASILECSEEELMTEDTVAAADADTRQPREAEVLTSAAGDAATNSAEVEEEEKEAERAEAQEADAEVEEEEKSEEELRADLAELQEQLEAAMEAEEFDECDALQTRIDSLEAKLS